MFYHEKLQVYDRALVFASQTALWINTWDKKHAVVDQLNRAVESILVNLAEAVRQRSEGARLQNADYAIGSSLECAGCLDVARIKGFLKSEECQREKQGLCEVTKMLIGLRKSWSRLKANEEPPAYLSEANTDSPEVIFHHEGLEVYRLSLDFMEWFVADPKRRDLGNRLFRQLDEAATSVVLNIAEGNGRYAELDHHRFLQIAQSAAVKAAVYLDLGVKRNLVPEADANVGKAILRRVGTMAYGF
jgi:four helix bundle protein